MLPVYLSLQLWLKFSACRENHAISQPNKNAAIFSKLKIIKCTATINIACLWSHPRKIN